MQDEWIGSVAQKPGSFLQAAAGIKQHVFARDFQVHAETGVCLEVINNHFGEVVNVNDDVSNAKRTQAGERDLKKRAAADLNESLGSSIGERTQTRAETRSQDHCLHLPRRSSPR